MHHTAGNSRPPFLYLSSWKDRWRCFTLRGCGTTGAAKGRWIWACDRVREWTSSAWRTTQEGNGWLALLVETVSLDPAERRLNFFLQRFFHAELRIFFKSVLLKLWMLCGWYLILHVKQKKMFKYNLEASFFFFYPSKLDAGSHFSIRPIRKHFSICFVSISFYPTLMSTDIKTCGMCTDCPSHHSWRFALQVESGTA